MKKVYNDTDEIEFRLVHNVADHYWLEWRFKEPGKFLWFKIRDKWKSLYYYTPGIFTPDENPDRYSSWYWRGFHLGRENEVREYEHIKANIKTKAQLYEYYHVKENMELYERHLEEHNKWLSKLNNNIEKHVK